MLAAQFVPVKARTATFFRQKLSEPVTCEAFIGTQLRTTGTHNQLYPKREHYQQSAKFAMFTSSLCEFLEYIRQQRSTITETERFLQK